MVFGIWLTLLLLTSLQGLWTASCKAYLMGLMAVAVQALTNTPPLFDFSCRGKAGKLQGNLAGVMAVLKGTPTTYNKDFQECWELMFDSVDALHDCIRIATGVLSTIKINPDRMMKVGQQRLLIWHGGQTDWRLVSR
jgi:hypothetical protein